MKNEECSQANELGYVVKSEQRAEIADIGMRVVTFCGRGD